MERLNDHAHLKPPPRPKGAKPEEPERIQNPGKGRRTPRLWGQWLTGGLKGLQRQMLDALNLRQSKAEHGHRYGGAVMYQGTADPEVVRRRRLKAKAGRRQRVHQSMARRGKR